MTEAQTIRGKLLAKAISLTEGERNQSYGDPIENFTRYAGILSGYFGVTFTAHDAAMIMLLAKIARIPHAPTLEDNYVDGAAYLAITAEMAAFGESGSFARSGQSQSNESKSVSGNAQGAGSVERAAFGKGNATVSSSAPTSGTGNTAAGKPGVSALGK